MDLRSSSFELRAFEYRFYCVGKKFSQKLDALVQCEGLGPESAWTHCAPYAIELSKSYIQWRVLQEFVKVNLCSTLISL